MSPSNRTLIDDFKNVVIANVEVEYQNNSTLIKNLPHMLNQNPKSDVKDHFFFFINQQSASSSKLSIDTLKAK